MQTIVLLFQCNDQKGIVSKISDYISSHDGNIITADQYSTDPEGGHFFLRIEFCIDENNHNKEALEKEFLPIAEHFSAEWKMHNKDKLLRMGILASKPDHCLAELLYLHSSGELNVEIPFVASNYEGHKDLVEKYGIPFHYIPATIEDRKEAEILSLASKESDFLVFARYMVLVSGTFLHGYGKDIINIHHSFLPSFKGANPYHKAFEKGVKVIGATAHFVTENLDEGPIITQIVEPVTHKDGVEQLIRKGKNIEKRALPQAIYQYIDYRIIKYQNRTIVF